MKKKTKEIEETGLLIAEEPVDATYRIQVKKSFWTKMRHGAVATVFTAVFLVLMIGLNILAGLLADRVKLRADLSRQQTFEVSDVTLDYLSSLEYDVEVIVLGDEQAWREYSSTAETSSTTSAGLGVSVQKYIVETLDRYSETSPRVKIYYANPLYNPAFFTERQNLPVTDDSGNEPVIIVYSAETHRYRYLYQSQFEDTQYLVLENRLNAAIAYTTNPDLQKIAIVNGHGESDLSVFANVMDYAYDFQLLNLSDVDAIPDEFFMLIISNPSESYSDSDIAKIDAFLSNDGKFGRHLIVCAGTEYSSKDTKLREYLKEWGIEIQDQVVYDPSHSLTLDGKPPMFTVEYSEIASDLTSRLAVNGYKMKFQLCQTRTLKRLFDEQNDVMTYSLLETASSSFARPMNSGTLVDSDHIGNVKKESTDATGPFEVGSMAMKVGADGLDEYRSTVTVFGSDSPVNYYFIYNADGENNATHEYMANLLNFAAAKGQEEFWRIPTVSLLTDALSFESNAQIILIYLFTVFAIPAVFAVIAFVTWKKRKYL